MSKRIYLGLPWAARLAISIWVRSARSSLDSIGTQLAREAADTAVELAAVPADSGDACTVVAAEVADLPVAEAAEPRPAAQAVADHAGLAQ